MIAKERGSNVLGALAALTLMGAFGVNAARSQDQGGARGGRKPVTNPGATAAPAQNAAAAPLPRLEQKAIPVNPTDPIAIINNEVITRQQLANECVVRKGEEILETLIARKLIDQALKANKLEVTAAEIDQEIDNVAMRVAGISREGWLRTLDKERGISPAQYAHDIIYPALALRKLSAKRVQVTPKDMNDSFEAQYGEKLRVRMIMVDKIQVAKEIWEELRKNPSGFEKTAMERSMDSSSRSLGGLLADPISRHAYPQTVSNEAFYMLVDGDPKDKDVKHKPKDGDITGPIQVAEATWVILRRESLLPAQGLDRNDPKVKKSVNEMIYEVKLKEAMGQYMIDLLQAASIENKMTGRVKVANEQYDLDEQVKLMGGNKPGTGPAVSRDSSTARPAPPASADGSTPRLKVPTPAALSSDVVKPTPTSVAPDGARRADPQAKPAVIK